MRTHGARSKGLAAQRLRNEREATGLRQEDVARFYRGGVGQCRIHKIEHQRNVSRAVERDFMRAVACAAAAQAAARSTTKKCDEQFAVVLNKVSESQRDKDWRAMPNLPACASYLATCSPAGLQSFALGRMAQAADLLKEVSEIFMQVVQQKAEAELAFWLLDYRQDLVKAPSVHVRRALPGSRKMLKARKEEKR